MRYLTTPSKTSLKRILIAVAILGISGWAYRSLRPRIRNPLPTASPQAAGLRWEECEFSQAAYEGSYPGRKECTERFQVKLAELKKQRNFAKANDQAPSGIPESRLTLKAGSRQCRISDWAFLVLETYALECNGTVISRQWMISDFPPHQTLQKVGDDVVWAFTNHASSTVVKNGTDLRTSYGLDDAYEPYGLNSHLIFVGKRHDQYQIIYDGQQIGPNFDEIFIAHCCESAAWSARGSAGQYLFQGKRGDRYYLVRIRTEAS